jgi:hypothetical protein
VDKVFVIEEITARLDRGQFVFPSLPRDMVKRILDERQFIHRLLRARSEIFHRRNWSVIWCKAASRSPFKPRWASMVRIACNTVV